MRSGSLKILGFGVGLTAAFCGPAPAEPTAGEDRAVSFELGTGVEYDSNVAVLELDTATNAGDAIAVANFGLGYDKRGKGRFDASAGYHFSTTLHDDFDTFDLTIHRASAMLRYDLDRVDTGVNLQYAHAELDGAAFLTLEQMSPYVSKLLGERLFLRFAYAHTDKDFAGRQERAATGEAWSSDVYVFINGLRSYLLFGYRLDDEDAIDPQLDYSGNRLRAQLTRRIPIGDRELTLKAAVRYETRDYANPTLSLGEARNDDRRQFEAVAEVPLTARVLARFGYKHADNRSNLPAVDFAENVYSVTFLAEL